MTLRHALLATNHGTQCMQGISAMIHCIRHFHRGNGVLAITFLYCLHNVVYDTVCMKETHLNIVGRNFIDV